MLLEIGSSDDLASLLGNYQLRYPESDDPSPIVWILGSGVTYGPDGGTIWTTTQIYNKLFELLKRGTYVEVVQNLGLDHVIPESVRLKAIQYFNFPTETRDSQEAKIIATELIRYLEALEPDSPINQVQHKYCAAFLSVLCKLAELESPAERYQTLFHAALNRPMSDVIGDRVRRLVREAVCEALLDCEPGKPNAALRNTMLSVKNHSDACSDASKNPALWNIPVGLCHLGYLVSRHQEVFGDTILTTNFDPLIELAIRRWHGSPVTVAIDRDVPLGHTHADDTLVIHAHGYWFGSDQLHTPAQFKGLRRAFAGSLAQFLLNKTICVIGYSGWDDALMEALTTALKVGAQIHWCFHEDNVVSENYRKIAEKLPATVSGRVSFYKGVDSNTFFERLREVVDSQREWNRKATSAGEKRLLQSKLASCEQELTELKRENQHLNQRVSDLQYANVKLATKLAASDIADKHVPELLMLNTTLQGLDKQSKLIQASIDTVITKQNDTETKIQWIRKWLNLTKGSLFTGFVPPKLNLD